MSDNVPAAAPSAAPRVSEPTSTTTVSVEGVGLVDPLPLRLTYRTGTEVTTGNSYTGVGGGLNLILRRGTSWYFAGGAGALLTSYSPTNSSHSPSFLSVDATAMAGIGRRFSQRFSAELLAVAGARFQVGQMDVGAGGGAHYEAESGDAHFLFGGQAALRYAFTPAVSASLGARYLQAAAFNIQGPAGERAQLGGFGVLNVFGSLSYAFR